MDPSTGYQDLFGSTLIPNGSVADLTVTSSLTLDYATASLPVKLDASKVLTSSLINLTTDVTGILPIARGGTNSSTALANGTLMVSSGGAIVEGTSSSNPLFTSATFSSFSPIVFNNATGKQTIGSIGTSVNQIIQLPNFNGTTEFILAKCDRVGGQQISTDLDLTGTNVYFSGLAPNYTLHLDAGGRIANNNDIIVNTLTSSSATPILLSGLTASLPLQLDATKQVVAAQTSLTTGVIGILPYANGGSTGVNTGDLTLAAIAAVPNANGATLAGQVLTLQPANASFGGIITTGTQSLAGNKSLSGSLIVSSDITANNAHLSAIN